MLVDLDISRKTRLIVGGGKVGERKAKRITKECSKLVVASKDFTDDLRRMHRNNEVELVSIDIREDLGSLDSFVSKADIVIAATDDYKINQDVVHSVKKGRALVCVVDNTSQSDFSFPAVSFIRGVQVAVYTGGKSPAMGKILF